MFEQTEKIFALAASDVISIVVGLRNQYGVDVDGIKTIAAYWDDENKTRLRYGSLTNGTVSGTPLSDGRVAFSALWPSALIEDFNNGLITDVEELSELDLEALKITSEI